MTTRRFLTMSLVLSAVMLAIAVWLAPAAPVPGLLLAVAALALAIWATGAYRRQLWAWRAARTFTALLFVLTAIALFALPVPQYWHYGARDPVFLASAACALALFAACFAGFRAALRHLRRVRGSFDAASELERRLGRLGRGDWMPREPGAATRRG